MAGKECNHRPAGTGVVEGDTSPMRDAGIGAEVSDNYGADLGPDATNSMGRITGATRSDGMQEGGYGKNKR